MPPEMMPLETPKKKTLRLPKYHIDKPLHENWPEVERAAFNIFGKQADFIYDIYIEIINWMKTPYVVDDLESHEERRAWYKYLDKKESDKMQYSKLRSNKTTSLLLMYQLLQKLLNEANLTDLPNEIFPPHQHDMELLKNKKLPNKELIEIIKKWEKQFAEVLKFIELRTREQKIAA